MKVMGAVETCDVNERVGQEGYRVWLQPKIGAVSDGAVGKGSDDGRRHTITVDSRPRSTASGVSIHVLP